jgi:hypothetical protein
VAIQQEAESAEQLNLKMRQYVAAGSTIKIMVYHRRSWKVFWILMTYAKGQLWRLPELVACHSEAQSGCPITYTYTRRDGRELCERNGFRVTETRVEHIFSYRISDYVGYRYVKVFCFRWMPLGLFRWLEHHFGWHLCLTAVAT